VGYSSKRRARMTGEERVRTLSTELLRRNLDAARAAQRDWGRMARGELDEKPDCPFCAVDRSDCSDCALNLITGFSSLMCGEAFSEWKQVKFNVAARSGSCGWEQWSEAGRKAMRDPRVMKAAAKMKHLLFHLSDVIVDELLERGETVVATASGEISSPEHVVEAPLSYDASEERIIGMAITHARRVQDFLWGEHNESWPLEEWRRMLRKHVAKVDAIDAARPHASVELRKRLLQTAAVCVNLIGKLLRGEVAEEASNLPEHAEKVVETPQPVLCKTCGADGCVRPFAVGPPTGSKCWRPKDTAHPVDAQREADREGVARRKR
jgi:hypothetical protein